MQVNKYDQALSVAFGLPPMMVGLLENSLDGAEFECPLLVWGFSVTAFGQWYGRSSSPCSCTVQCWCRHGLSACVHVQTRGAGFGPNGSRCSKVGSCSVWQQLRTKGTSCTRNGGRRRTTKSASNLALC